MLINKFNLIKIKMAPSHLYKKEQMYLLIYWDWID